jgi:hypothetical protein
MTLAALAEVEAHGKLSAEVAQLVEGASLPQLKTLVQMFREKATRRINGMELPETGRSSVEGTLADRFGSSISFWGSVSPVIDFQMLSLLKSLWIYNPDMSQFVSNIVNLANTGHQITVDASSARRAEQAITRINESASRLYRNGAGIDGLINAYLAQIAWSGALSSEDVVNFAQRRVDKVVLVPVEQIRFRYLEGEYVPHQKPGVGAGLTRSPLGLVRLNDETYHYYALQTVENSPYAKPPASAAVASITGPQTDMLDNIKFIAKKLGLLGLVSLVVTKPDKDESESDAEYHSRARAYLAAVGAAAENLSNKGLIVTFDDQKVEHSNVQSNGSGAYDLFRISEEQVFSGMASIPAFHGRTDSTTETYAYVMYHFMKAQSSNVQRLAKRRQERTYRLDLRLAGIEVNGISLGFNNFHALKPLEEADARKLRVETALLLAEKGVISPDKAAQEMGYDSAFDPALMVQNPEAAKSLRALSPLPESGERHATLTFRFDTNSQTYKHVPHRLYTIEKSQTIAEQGAMNNGHDVLPITTSSIMEDVSAMTAAN